MKMQLLKSLSPREEYWLRGDPQAAELFRRCVTDIAFHLTISKTQIQTLKLIRAAELEYERLQSRRHFLPKAKPEGRNGSTLAHNAELAMRDFISPSRALISKGLIKQNPNWSGEGKRWTECLAQAIPRDILTEQGRLTLRLIELAGL